MGRILMKKLTTALLPLALLVTSFGALAATSDGNNFAVSAGWAHIMPQGTKQGVQSTSNNPNIPSGFNSAAGFELDNTDTAEFKFDYLVNDNVSLGLVLGVPPTLDIQGKGTLLGSLDLNKKVGEVKVYSPVVTGKYTFGQASNKFRPYAGAGFMYAHFSDFELSSDVTNDAVFKALQGSITNVKIKDAVAPVAFIGADYNINPNWFVTAAVSYVHLNTRAKLDLNGTHPLAGKFTVNGESKIEINPIVTYLGVGYRF